MRVLVVDDSVIFRSQISKALTGATGIESVAIASSGALALQKLAADHYDVMTLDMEMPGLSGIEVLRELRKLNSTVKTIVFSSQTASGARLGLQALEEGARDIVSKPEVSPGDDPLQVIRELLVPRITQFKPNAGFVPRRTEPALSTSEIPAVAANREVKRYPKKMMNQLKPAVIVIASSTGGPTALEEVFRHLNRPPTIPIAIVQHMPPVFTGILATRLSELTGWKFCEAKNGEALLPGCAYIAPGNFHMKIEMRSGAPVLTLNQAPQRCSVRPSADFLFESAAEVFGANTLGIVLTGMGEDGLEGTRALKNAGAGIYIQDRESCTVFGMPGAVFAEGCYDAIGNPQIISDYLQRFCSESR